MDLLAIGGIAFDKLFWVDRLPETHFEAVIEKHGVYFGGRAPNAAVAAARLGIKTGIVSLVGEDFESEGYEDYLRKVGVDLRGVIKVRKARTKRIFIFTDPQKNQITFLNHGAEKYLRRRKTPSDLIKDSKIVHISSSGDYRFNLRCARYAYQNNVSVSFDPANDPSTEIPQYLRTMIEYCSLLFMNDVEALCIVKRLKLSTTKDLLSFGPSTIVIINKNDKSSSIHTKNDTVQIPSAIRVIKDPTGTSDGYIAAFLAGHIKGCDTRTAGMLGSVEASFIAESFGSQTNLPNWELLYERCKEWFKNSAKFEK